MADFIKQNVQWFPGHMAKTRRLIKESLNLVDGVVEMMMDATQNYALTTNKERLMGWHAALFPTGYSGMYKIEVGKYRTDSQGPMQVVSGYLGQEKIHYEAPSADTLEKEMNALIEYINTNNDNPIIKAAIAHLWFVILHPFDDGNGRIARALTELLLARSESSANRFYSMSSQIAKERKEYYKQLEITQQGDLNITDWLEWFLQTLEKAIKDSDELLKTVLAKATFWKQHQGETFNDRQSKMLNMLFDGFTGHLTSTKWAKICKCSHDTASRDIADLQQRGILEQIGAGRTTHYILNRR